MDKEQFLNILRSLNSYLDELRNSLTTVERDHPKQLSYLTQLHKSVKVNNRYKICYSVPTLGDCGSCGDGDGDGGGGACAWIKNSDFNGVIESWKTDGRGNVVVATYMDSLDQFNSTIDQIQAIKIDYFELITPEYEPSRLDKIFSIDFSPWLDTIKAKLKQEFSIQPSTDFVHVSVERYFIEDMSAPQPIMDALNALSELLPYQGTTVYEASVEAGAMLMQTAENQYAVLVLASIEFLNHDGEPLTPRPVWAVIQTCFKGGNIAAFGGETGSKLPDNVLSSNEGTKWLKSQDGFTTIFCAFSDLT